MSLDSVAEDIREQARAEAEEIREEATARADELIAEAEADAEEILETSEREVESQIDQEREQGLSSAKLEAKQLRLRARREALDEVREAVESRIEAIDGDERAQLTEALLETALAEFDDDEALIIHGRAADDDLLESLCSEDRLSVGEPVDRLGGVIVEGTTSSIRVDNSFDAVLKDVWDDNLRSISDSLFEE